VLVWESVRRGGGRAGSPVLPVGTRWGGGDLNSERGNHRQLWVAFWPGRRSCGNMLLTDGQGR
jgi:hypothetical protein